MLIHNLKIFQTKFLKYIDKNIIKGVNLIYTLFRIILNHTKLLTILIKLNHESYRQ